MIRGTGFVALVVAAVLAASPAASWAVSGSAVRRAVDRVEIAAVDDNSGACAVMGPIVRRDYIQGAEVTSGARTAPTSCAAAVRDDHAGYVRNHELAAERAAQRAVVKAFAAGRVTFSKGHKAIAVAHLQTRRFLGSVQTTVTARLIRSAATWTVLTVSESPTGVTSPPPPIP